MTRREFLSFSAPSAILMALLMVGPLLMTLYLSLQNFTYGSDPVFLGLDNYSSVLGSDRFWSSMTFTMIYTVAVTIIKIVLGFALALLLAHVVRGRSVLLGMLLVPLVVPPVIGALVFGWMFRTDLGFYSWALSLVGVEIGWFSEGWAARTLVVAQGVWEGTAFAALILLAGLQSMSKEPVEAAIVDGASWWQRQRFVVAPALTGLFVFIAMMSVMDGFRIFDPIASLTAGGPAGATESVMFFNFSIAFDQQQLGLGSAVSVITVVAVLILIAPFLVYTWKDASRR